MDNQTDERKEEIRLKIVEITKLDLPKSFYEAKSLINSVFGAERDFLTGTKEWQQWFMSNKKEIGELGCGIKTTLK